MFSPSTRYGRRGSILAFLVVGIFGAPATAQPPAPAVAVWRTDYNAAREEAREKGLPLLVVVGTQNCFYCRKLEANTFRDPGVNGLLATGFVPLKIDATAQPALAQALKVKLYPTMVVAGSDGKIHAFIEGYVEADRLAEHMKRAVTAASTTDWMARDYNEASKAIGVGDYPRAVSLLKGIIGEAGGKPVGVKATEVLAGIERQAAGRLARARDLELKGYTPDAMDTLTDLMKTYSGTQAASDAANRMAGLAEKPDAVERQLARQARDLLAMAKEEFRTGRYYDCLQKCDQLAVGYAGTPEGTEAEALATEVRNNPDRLAVACEQMNDRTAAMYLTLAESWMKKGQRAEATACLEKVMKLSPASRHAELAQGRLTSIQGRNPATAAGFKAP